MLTVVLITLCFQKSGLCLFLFSLSLFMIFFPAKTFTISSVNSFEQNVKRLNANFADKFFVELPPGSASTYNTDDTYYFVMKTKGRGGLKPFVKCIIKPNADSPSCSVFCRARLHPVNWSFIIFLTILMALGVTVTSRYISIVLVLIVVYALYLLTFQLDVKHLKEKLESVFSGTAS